MGPVERARESRRRRKIGMDKRAQWTKRARGARSHCSARRYLPSGAAVVITNSLAQCFPIHSFCINPHSTNAPETAAE
jgi:hypothetical protein